MLWRDDPPTAPTTLVAIVAAALVAVGSLARIFDGPHYLLYAIPAVAIGAAIAFLYGKRSIGAAFVGVALIWVISLSPLFAPRALYHGLPSPGALRTVRALFASGLTRAPQETLPIPAVPRYAILLWTSLLFLGFLGASWVLVRRPVGAVVTALGVVAFAGGIGSGGGRDVVAVAAVAVIGLFFLFEGRHRIERWGRARTPLWFGVPTIVAASVFAAAAPVLFGEGPALNINSPLRPRLIIIKPLSDVRRQLKVDPPLEVMRVVAPRPTYWRLTALDTYDGTEWLLRAHPRSVDNGRVPPPNPPPLAGDQISQRYRLTSLLAPWLPAAYAANAVSSPATVDVDTSSQTLLLRGNTRPGLVYGVSSTIPRVTRNVAVPLHASGNATERLFANVARPWVSGARTPLDMARRIERHFRGYTYDENVPGGHSVARLQSFLAARRGYCEQYAATMTLMLRGLGIPARVGVGFLPGGFEGDGTYVVTTREAHAWVEADIPGAGWVTFDPTPGRGSTSSVPPSLQERSRPAPLPPAPRPTALPVPTPQRQPLPNQVTQPHRTSIPVRRALPYVLAALLIGSVPGAKALRRRRRRGASDPRTNVLGAYAELVDTANDLGWAPRSSETQREFCRRLFADNGGEPEQLVDASLRALYSPDRMSDHEARAAWQALAPATGTLRKKAPPWRRAVAVFDPRTFVARYRDPNGSRHRTTLKFVQR